MIAAMARPAVTPDAFGRIREGLSQYAYAGGAPDPDAPPLVRLLGDLFVDGRSVPARDVEAALGQQLVADLVGAGLVRRAEDAVVARVCLMGLEGLLLAGDRADRRRGRWFVTAPFQGTRAVAAAMPHIPGAALDVGSGGGALGLLARHRGSARVVATDVNPRALEYVKRNAQLNGLDAIETREGSWFEPATGERFDLITAHLPYVVGPERLLWRDAGEGAERQLARLAPDALDCLAPDGIACLMGNWPSSSSDPGLPIERLPGADVLVVRLHGHPIEEYAQLWSGEAGGLPPNPARAERWLRNLQGRGIASISGGLLYLRRRAGASGRPRLIEAWNPGAGAGEHVLGAFAGMDELRRRQRLEDLLNAPLRPAMRVGIVAPRTPDGPAEVRMREGLHVRVGVDPRCRDVLHLLDGRPLREVLADVAVARGEDADELAIALAPDLRTLLGAGMLACAE